MRVVRARTQFRDVRRILLAPLAAVALLAGLLPAIAPPAQAATLFGHDISWPQCPSSVGGFACGISTTVVIASALFLSHRTVQNHVQNIFGKLHLNNRVELVRFAFDRGIDPVSPPEPA